MTLQHLRSSTANKRPDPTAMADGQIALNTAAASPGLFYKDSAGNLVKAGPVHVGSTAPNVSPASGGTAGNSTGESWLDTSGSNPLLKVWNGSSWQTVQPVASGTVVSTADTGSVTSTMIADGTIVNADVSASAAIAGSKISPDFGSQNVTTTGTSTAASFIPTSSTVPTNGVYLPAANSVAISTNGAGRLFVDSTGRVGVNNSGPSFVLDISGGAGTGVRYQNTTNSVANYFGADSVSAQIGSTTNHPLAFLTNATERMRLTSTGLGIGTSSVNGLLHLATAETRAILLNNSSIGTAAGDGTYISNKTDGSFAIINQENNSFTLGTNNTDRLTITGGGLVGIGSTNPGAFSIYNNLVVENSSNPGITLSNSSGAGTAGIHFAATSTFQGKAEIGCDITTGALFAKVAGTERCRVDNSGRLLVGTTSSSDGNCSAAFQGNPTSASNGAQVHFRRGEAATAITSGEAIGYLVFTDNADKQFAYIGCEADANAGTNDYPGRLVFSVSQDGSASPTERLRLANDGRITTYSSNDDAFIVSNYGAANTSGSVFAGKYSATSIGTGTTSVVIYRNGNVVNTNNSYGSLSDIKLKENIVDAGSQWNDLKSLQVRKYNFKEGQTHTQIGLVAQEVELVSPGLVSESPDRDAEGNDLGTTTKSVNYSVLYMKAVKALQEAMERIETLEAKVAALESA